MRLLILRCIFPLLASWAIPAIAQNEFPSPPIVPHSHANGKVLWEIDGTKDGTTAHNHMWARSFGGYDNEIHEPYSAYGCWNNKRYEVTTADPFDLGHCFINSSSTTNEVTYSFNGSNWSESEKQVVRKAFLAWNALYTPITSVSPHGVAGNTVGIKFREVSSSGDIGVSKEDLGSLANGAELATFGLISNTIRFNNNSSIAWDTSTAPGSDDNTKYHMLTVAIHEVGHAVGLEHQHDVGDVMQERGPPNPWPDPKRALFFSVDLDSAHGAYELYGQTPALSPTISCFDPPLFLGCPPGCMSSPYLMQWSGQNAASYKVQWNNFGLWTNWYTGSNTESFANTGTIYHEHFKVQAINAVGVASGWCYMTLYVQCSDEMDPW